MEAVPPDPLIGEVARQGESGGDLWLVMMEGRVETGDLRQCRKQLGDGGDGGEVMGLVERRERNEPAQLCDHRCIDEHGGGVVRSAMDDAVRRPRPVAGRGSGPQPAQVARRGAFVGRRRPRSAS